jgi:hypothetical protein
MPLSPKEMKALKFKMNCIVCFMEGFYDVS